MGGRDRARLPDGNEMMGVVVWCGGLGDSDSSPLRGIRDSDASFFLACFGRADVALRRTLLVLDLLGSVGASHRLPCDRTVRRETEAHAHCTA